ncbi:MAG TPA: hypothetical protein VHY09_02180 [Candidatus Methylacidiphilales bacterium]|jgi:hypothetical protein|nr:hypothetical protein [Candidatus Methylacidiphilales bacterium]
MFPATDNPAQRLLDILNEARKQPHGPISQVWEKVFNLKMDPPNFYKVCGHLNNLVDLVEIRIKQIKGLNHGLFLRDLPAIRRIVSPTSMGENWNSIKGPLETGALTGLEFCSNELGKLHIEIPIPNEDLKRLRAEFATLMTEISNSEIASELKMILSDLAASSLLAIDQYRILGNEGLKKAVAYAIGTVTLHRDQFVGGKSESFVRRSMDSIMSLCKLVSAAYKVGELAAPELAKLLDHVN